MAPVSLGPWAAFDYDRRPVRRRPPTDRGRPLGRHEVAEADPVPDNLHDASTPTNQAGRAH